MYKRQIDSVMKDSPASKLGLAKGDKILAINNKTVVSFNEFQIELGRVEDVLASAETPPDSARALTAQVTYLKASGDTVKSSVLLKSTAEGVQFGFYNHPVLLDYKITHVNYGFFESFPAGIKYCLLYTSGELICNLAQEYHVPILPVDSEHSAIFQSLVDVYKRQRLPFYY